GRRALAVGVLDPEDERAPGPAREEPVVQCRPRAADVERPGRRRSEADPHALGHTAMLIGGHVSPAGGLVKAFERGVERDCDSIQIFNQSPRAWRFVNYRPDDVAEFSELIAAGPVQAIVLHAVYLINPASKDEVIRQK